MARALYRKYRPKSLKDVVGQPQVTDILAKSLEDGKVSHAYLFVGPRGTGKTSVARILAHEVNGFKYEIEDDYVDIVEIDGASNRGIDNIRELREKALIAPTSGKYKVYIIDEVHMLTKEAFNALLKTLEEPPKHVIFIMATTDAIKVPVTITSRAQTYTFRLADYDTMFEFLKKVTKEEKIKISDDALSIIVKRGGGSFRDSLSLLDQISTLSKDEITKELVVSAMGLPEDEKIKTLLDEYVSGDVVKITTLLKELLSSGVRAETIAEELISYIVDNPSPKYFSLLSKLPDVKAPFPEAKLLVALAPKEAPVTQDRVVAPQPQPAVDFSWDNFINKVKDVNDAVYSQLLKTTHKYANGGLDIFPEKRIVKTILTRDNNQKILIQAAGNNVKITIHDVSVMPVNDTNDTTLTKISAIMGGEVKNDGGENPF